MRFGTSKLWAFRKGVKSGVSCPNIYFEQFKTEISKKVKIIYNMTEEFSLKALACLKTLRLNDKGEKLLKVNFLRRTLTTNSNVVQITKENLTFEKNVPLRQRPKIFRQAGRRQNHYVTDSLDD